MRQIANEKREYIEKGNLPKRFPLAEKDKADTAKVAQSLRALKPGDVIRYDLLRGGKPGHVDVPIPAGLSVPLLMKPKK